MEAIQNFDFFVLNGIQDTFKCDFLDSTIPVLTHLGHGVIWALLGIIFILMKKHRFNGMAVISALIVTVLISEYVIKPLFMRERPYLSNPQILLLIPEPSGTSFPSSHTSTSFASAVQFFGINKKAGIFALIGAGIIGFTRLYLYVHFPTDVLAGAILGTLTGIIVMLAANKLRERFRKEETQ